MILAPRSGPLECARVHGSSPTATPAISVVIPAFNEELRLARTLETSLEFLASRGELFEIIVVDDGSGDGTFELARSFEPRGVRALRLPSNRGKGAALKAGVLVSTGRRVLLADADSSVPIEELPRLEAELSAAPLVFASRAEASSRIEKRQPFYRQWMGKIFNLILRFLRLTELHDTQCGFKLIEGEIARALFREMTVERFAFDVELLVLARVGGHRVREVGVPWSHEPQSRVHPILDSSRMFYDVVRLAWRHRRRT